MVREQIGTHCNADAAKAEPKDPLRLRASKPLRDASAGSPLRPIPALSDDVARGRPAALRTSCHRPVALEPVRGLFHLACKVADHAPYRLPVLCWQAPQQKNTACCLFHSHNWLVRRSAQLHTAAYHHGTAQQTRIAHACLRMYSRCCTVSDGCVYHACTDVTMYT